MTGYSKDSTYNVRLRFRGPPYFIDPVQATWQIVRKNGQVPPR